MIHDYFLNVISIPLILFIVCYVIFLLPNVNISSKYKNKLLTKSLVRVLLHGLVIISLLIIYIIKFTPLKNLPEPKWFNYGEEFLDLLFNLSYSYLVSAIFYFVVVYIPQYLQSKSAMSIIQSRLVTIGRFMDMTTHYFYLKMDTDDDFNNLTEIHFEQFTKLTKQFTSIKYIEWKPNLKKWGEPVYYPETEIDRLFQEQKMVSEIISQIFTIPSISTVSPELIEALSELRDCWFYHGIRSYADHANHGTTSYEFSVGNFNKSIFRYYQLYKLLSKYWKLNEIRYILENDTFTS